VRVCPACGGENADGNRFCGSCGAALAAAPAGRRRLVTSVLCDLSGSTALGEAADPEAVYGLIRAYFDVARAALEGHGGTVEKFIGDAVIGMFGRDEPRSDDALRACRAALEIQDGLAALNLELESRSARPIAVRIGVETREVAAGGAVSAVEIDGSSLAFLGDAVNAAGRLERRAAPGEVLIGESTYRLVQGAVTAEAVALLSDEGGSDALVAYRLSAANG
jgi:class 3 adenylate cyclase